MLFIVALIISIIFVAVFKELFKKYPNLFYITAAVISIAAFVCSSYVTMPGWVRDYVVGIFAKGSLGTAFFVLVMYAGAMKNTWKATKTLMKIRGELSIMGCVLVLCHNCTYGRTYFRMLFTNTKSLSAAQMTAAIISLVLITIMLILTVTSFPQVRKKMNAVKWKKLQRTAYIFYGLIYVHILLINVPYARITLRHIQKLLRLQQIQTDLRRLLSGHIMVRTAQELMHLQHLEQSSQLITGCIK